MPDYPAARKGDNVSHIKGGGAILDGSPNVRINGLPAARQGDPVQHNNRTETITQGSSSVKINGKPAARVTDKVGCGGSIVAGSASVFIGNGPTGRACSTCPNGIAVGNPVNPLLGAKVLGAPEDLDFALPGAMPVVWQRHYSSYVSPAGHAPGLLGTGWRLPFELHLILSDDKTDLFDTKNRTIAFHALPPGAQHYSQSEGFWLMRGSVHEVLNPDPAQQTQAQQAAWQNDPLWRHIPEAWRQDPHYVMAASGDRSVWLFAAADVTVVPGVTPWLLTAMVDVLGRQQRYQRHIKTDERKSQFKNQLHTIVDGTGRRFALDYTTVRRSHTDDSGLRLSGVRLQGESGNASEDTVLVSYGYSNAGDLASVTDRHGRTVRQFGYDHHRMSSHSVMGGPVASYVYESELPGAKVTLQRNAGALDYRFDYQPDRTVVTDTLGRTQTFQFDGEGSSRRLVRYFDATGAWSDYQHNMTGALVRETDALGQVTAYDRDMQGRLKAVTGPDGSQTKSHWNDASGTLQSVTAPDGAVSHFDHDAWARLLQTTAPDGSVTAYRYLNPNESPGARLTAEHPRQIVDAKGGIKQLTWTVLGQLASYTDCSGQTTRYSYDAWGLLLSVTNAKNETLRYSRYSRYSLGQVEAVHYPDGTQVRYVYDSQGQLVQIKDAAGQLTTYRRDAHGRVLQSRQGHQTLQYAYDIAGRLVTLTNENGAHTSFKYDVLDRLIEEIGFDGRTQRYAYDRIGQLIESSDQGGGQGRGQEPPVIVTRYDYDKAGRLVSRTILPTLGKSNGKVLLDGLENTFKYSLVGQLIQAASAHTTVTWKRDIMGRIVRESLSHKDDKGRFEHALTHQYDPLGIRQATHYPQAGVIDYLTYGSGHLHQIAHDKTGLIDFECDSLHREIKRSVCVEPGTSATYFQRQFDPMGRLVDVYGQGPRIQTMPVAGDGIDTRQPLIGGLSRSLDYDPIGQLTRIHQGWRNGASIERQAVNPIDYRYDDAHRLIGAHYPNGDDQTWRFDPAGNRLPSPVPAGTPQFNNKWIDSWKDNRVQFDATQILTHDSWGNIIQIDSADGSKLSLRYDALHRIKASQLIQPTQDAHGQPCQYVITTHCQYDALSRRFGKHVVEGYLGQPDENDWLHTTWYGWDGDRLTTTQTEEEAEEGEGNADGRVIGNTVTTVYEPNSFVPLIRIETKADKQEDGNALTQAAEQAGIPKEQRQQMEEVVTQGLEGGAEGVLAISPYVKQALDSTGLPASEVVREAQALAPTTPKQYSQHILFFHCDHLGTPVALYDRKGSIVWNCELDPWGNTRREYNPLKIEQPIRMQGQQFDRETGLFYNRYRYYDPMMGRYVTQDPTGLSGGVHQSAYVSGNPMQKIDPYGLIEGFGNYAVPALGDLIPKSETPKKPNGITGFDRNPSPAGSKTCTPSDGKSFKAPSDIDFSMQHAKGVSTGKNPIAINDDLGQFGAYDYQRQGTIFVNAYADAGNYGIGVYMHGAGFSLTTTKQIGAAYGAARSKNSGSNNWNEMWEKGWSDAANGLICSCK